MAELRNPDSYVKGIGFKIKTTSKIGGEGAYMWVYFNTDEDPPAIPNFDREMERKYTQRSIRCLKRSVNFIYVFKLKS